MGDSLYKKIRLALEPYAQEWEKPNPPGTKRPRHIVEMKRDANGNFTREPTNHCLCGYVWDVFPIPFDPGSGVCVKCIEELSRRQRG